MLRGIVAKTYLGLFDSSSAPVTCGNRCPGAEHVLTRLSAGMIERAPQQLAGDCDNAHGRLEGGTEPHRIEQPRLREQRLFTALCPPPENLREVGSATFPVRRSSSPAKHATLIHGELFQRVPDNDGFIP